MTTLTELLDSAQAHASGLQLELDGGWMQGRSCYGGLQAAIATKAMLPFSDGLSLRTLQATLCSPVPKGLVEVDVQVLRTGANTRHIQARLLRGEELLALFVGVFGRDRESIVNQDFQWPEITLNAGQEFPYIPGAMPEFLQHFEARLLRGHFPGAGQPDLSHIFQLSLKDSVATATLPQVLAIADYPPPVALSWLKGMKPGSTMTWTLNFTGHDFLGQSLKNWVIDVELDAARGGYTQQTVTIFAPDGFAIARGTQCMVIFG